MSLTRPHTARVWVNFNGTGTVAINDSYNVSSLTDNGTGDYSITFDNDMANANYVTVISGRAASTNTIFQMYDDGSARTVSDCRVYVSNTTAVVDAAFLSLVVFGDAA